MFEGVPMCKCGTIQSSAWFFENEGQGKNSDLNGLRLIWGLMWCNNWNPDPCLVILANHAWNEFSRDFVLIQICFVLGAKYFLRNETSVCCSLQNTLSRRVRNDICPGREFQLFLFPLSLRSPSKLWIQDFTIIKLDSFYSRTKHIPKSGSIINPRLIVFLDRIHKLSPLSSSSRTGSDLVRTSSSLLFPFSNPSLQLPTMYSRSFEYESNNKVKRNLVCEGQVWKRSISSFSFLYPVFIKNMLVIS